MKAKAKACKFCGGNAKRVDLHQAVALPGDPDREIVIDTHMFLCNDCDMSWITPAELQRIDDLTAKAAWETLKPVEVKLIRESLGFNTKSEAARFFGLNHKAFTRIENGYEQPNFSTDLLLRLVAHSSANVRFVEDLRKKNFKFERRDYELICESVSEQWAYKSSRSNNFIDSPYKLRLPNDKRVEGPKPKPHIFNFENSRYQNV